MSLLPAQASRMQLPVQITDWNLKFSNRAMGLTDTVHCNIENIWLDFTEILMYNMFLLHYHYQRIFDTWKVFVKCQSTIDRK